MTNQKPIEESLIECALEIANELCGGSEAAQEIIEAKLYALLAAQAPADAPPNGYGKMVNGVFTLLQPEEVRAQWDGLVTNAVAAERERCAKLMNLLERAAKWMEGAPDKVWWREYFLLTGEHMILTEEGWEAGTLKWEYEQQAKADGEDIEDWILDEVNGPVTATQPSEPQQDEGGNHGEG